MTIRELAFYNGGFMAGFLAGILVLALMAFADRSKP